MWLRGRVQTSMSSLVSLSRVLELLKLLSDISAAEDLLLRILAISIHNLPTARLYHPSRILLLNL